MNNYRYNNNIDNIFFKYTLTNKQVLKVNYLTMLNILELNNKFDDVGINYNKCTSRQLQKLCYIINKSDDIKQCNVICNDITIF